MHEKRSRYGAERERNIGRKSAKWDGEGVSERGLGSEKRWTNGEN